MIMDNNTTIVNAINTYYSLKAQETTYLDFIRNAYTEGKQVEEFKDLYNTVSKRSDDILKYILISFRDDIKDLPSLEEYLKSE
jgi:hypothetical protein